MEGPIPSFPACKTPEERWARFQERIAHPGSDQELMEVFASVMAPGPSALPFGKGDWWRRWSDLARSSKDLRVRALFSRYEARVHEADTGETLLGLSSDQLAPGERLSLRSDERRIHLERTRLRWDAVRGLEPTDEIDTVWWESGRSGTRGFSEPMKPGLWRLTVVDRPEFVQAVVNIAERNVSVLSAGDELVVIAERMSKVHFFRDGAWQTRITDPRGIFRCPLDSLGPDTGDVSARWIAVQDERQVVFGEVLVGGPSRTEKIMGFVWTERTTLRKGTPLRLSGFVRAFDGDGVSRREKGADSVQVNALTVSPVFKGLPKLKLDRQGWFRTTLQVSDSAHPGEVSLAVNASGKALEAKSDPGGIVQGQFEHRMNVLPAPGDGDVEVRGPVGKREPYMHFCFDRQAHLMGDSAWMSLQVRNADGTVAPTKVRLGLVGDPPGSATEIMADPRGFVRWKFAVPRTEGPFAIVAKATVDGIELVDSSRSGWAYDPAEVPFADAKVRLVLDKPSYRAGESVRVQVVSAWKGAAVAVFPSARRIGDVFTGRISNGSLALTFPIGDLGPGLKVTAVVMGPKGRVWVDTALVLRGGGGFADVSTRIEGDGSQREVEISMADQRGRKLSSMFSVRVSNRLSDPGRWESEVARMEPLVQETRWSILPLRAIEPWSRESLGSEAWRWFWSGGSEGRPMKKPRDPCGPDSCPMDVSSRTAWDFKPDGFRNCGQRGYREAGLPDEQVVYWNDRVETGLFRSATVRFRLPDQGGPWFLEIMGTAGDRHLVHHVVGI